MQDHTGLMPTSNPRWPVCRGTVTGSAA
jgi:hypothetical protein